MSEQAYASQLQSAKNKKSLQQSQSALNTKHIRDNFSDNYRPSENVTAGSIEEGQEAARKRQSGDHKETQVQAENTEPEFANRLARQKVSQKIKAGKGKQKDKKQETNVAGPMLKVGIAFCLVRDFIWFLAIVISILPLIFTQMAALNMIIIADVICLLPFFSDKRFITFLSKEFLGLRKSKKGDLAKKGAKAAAKKIGLAFGEFLLVLVIFIPGYTFIMSKYIGKFEKAPKSDGDLSLSSLKSAIIDSKTSSNGKKQSTARLSKAANAVNK